ncbi:D123-domain-containing protein [Pyronema omphalodes]|nr:D123-domain-containing protein [Pyronema omphalodes]
MSSTTIDLEATGGPSDAPASPTLAPARTLRDIFPPVYKTHILNCSYPKWHTKYRSLTPKTRIIPLDDTFISYLRADGIVLPSDEDQITTLDSDSEDEEEDSDDDEGSPQLDPCVLFPEIHQKIKDTIHELGGKVAPKLNWSSPKDATFMTANSAECRKPGDIYLLFKSSDFITHDLEHAYDECIDEGVPAPEEQPELEQANIPYGLVLRKWFKINPSMEFRCFVRGRRLLAVSQRELNHFEFLEDMKNELLYCIREFFDENLRYTFPDGDFVFDCYIPMTEAERKKVWLIDINPFAPRTDPLLFSWVELLELPFDGDEAEGRGRYPELRLVKKGDPEAYSFATPQYSTSKLPQEVVQAGLEGDEAIWEFAKRWKDIVGKMEAKDKKAEEDKKAEGMKKAEEQK